MGVIYIIKNRVNSNVYIGQTTRDIKTRFREHILCAKNNSTTKLGEAIRNIGEQFFYIEELEKCPDDELDSREIYYIKKYDSYNNGLNSTKGGFGVLVDPNQNIPNIVNDYFNGVSIVNIAIKYNLSANYIADIISKCNIKADRKNIELEKTNEAKAIVMYDMDFNAKMKFDSIMQAIEWLSNRGYMSFNIMNGYTRIKEACNNGSTAYGFRWQYLNDLIYDNIEFNKKYDIEAYKNGGEIKINENGLAEVYNRNIEYIRNIKNNHKCAICGGYKREIKAKMCRECYNKLDKSDRPNGFENRQVPKDMKINYPLTKEQFEELYPKYTINSIAKACGVSYTTMNKLAKKYGIK